jgi:queuine/archaeosine tRNA-ribosyltransferase
VSVRFEVLARDGTARRGRLATAHGASLHPAGTVNLRNARHVGGPAPLNPDCRCTKEESR